MNRAFKSLLIIAGVATVAAVAVWFTIRRGPQPPQREEGQAMQPKKFTRVREPAVAGLFYPGDAASLSRAVDTLLASVKPHAVPGDLKALICPHAGYQYSGLTAAFSYKLLAGRDFRTVFVMAGSHYAMFNGASVCVAEGYRTPLGDVEISEKAGALAKAAPFVPEPRVPLRRPEWCLQASHPVPPPGEDTPETWEHSGEVQVPFLQKVLKNFKMVSVVFGQVNAEQAACALADQLDDKSLVIASTDLSHYHPYDEATKMDHQCVKAICDLDIARMTTQEACGSGPVLTLMHLARLKGWKTRLLDYRNSGDVTGNRAGGVVGYAAIAFYAPEPQTYSTEERKQLLHLARKTIKETVTNGRPSPLDASQLAARFAEPKGCFVTLTSGGQLRGCIGNILPQAPLHQAVFENAISSATRDHRFPPVQPAELDKIEIEISVLTAPKPLSFSSPEDLLGKLQAHKDGVVLQMGGQMSTYLPQVWEHFPDKVKFLDSLAEKAGCAPARWREPQTSVLTYRVESFSESDL